MKKIWPALASGFAVLVFLFLITKYYHQDIFAKLLSDQSAVQQSLLDTNLSAMDLAPHRLYIIVFWALWSEKSERELIFLQQLQEKIGPQLEVIAINTDFLDLRPQVEEFLANKAFSFRHLFDQRGELVNQLKISSVPATLIYRYGKLGIYLQQHQSLHSLDELAKFLPRFL